MRRWCRTCLTVCLMVVLWLAPAAPAVAAYGGSPSGHPAVPVVLVHGLGGGPTTWEAGPGGGLWRDLLRAGYRPGVNLFRLEESNMPGEDVDALASRLEAVVGSALRSSGARQVDIVAHSSGALAARFYTEVLAPAGRVRTLVMIAPPNRGSFAANALRVAAFSKALAAGVADDLALALSGAALQDAPDLDRAREALAEPGAEADELAAERRWVRDLWLPLMSWFVVRERLLPEGGRPLGDDTFADWMEREHPNLWAEIFAPDESGSGVDGIQSRDAIRDLVGRAPVAALSPAYERLLAFEVADQAAALAQGMADARPPLPDLARVGGAAAGGFAQGGWGSALWHATVTWLGQWAERAVHALGKPALETGGRLAGAWASRQWLGLDAASPVLARLVTERVDLPRSRPDRAGSRAGDVPANRLLWAWNRWGAEEAPLRATRYGVISGQTLNVWSWLSIRAGSNDGAVEVAATLPPAGPLDVWRVVRGGYSATHFALPALPAVRRAVLAALDPFAGALHATAGRTVRAEASDSAPAMVQVGAGSGRLEIRGPDTGRVLAAWIAPDGTFARPLHLTDGAWEGGLPAGYLAIRLVPAPGRPAVGLRGTASLSWQEGPGGGETSPPVDMAPAPGGTVGSEADGLPSGTSEPARRGDSEPSFAGGGGSEEVPLIRVVLHSRLTTDRKPKRVEHARWEWTFGDGESLDDRDASHVVTDVTHVFAQPGPYAVTASSYTADGTLIRRLRWHASAASPGESQTFHAESIRAPDVRLDLDGPAAWMAGRPATFHLKADLVPPAFMASWQARWYPGPTFQVLWSRPGEDFAVRAAVALTVKYAFPDGTTFTAHDTYVTEREVDVYATSVVR